MQFRQNLVQLGIRFEHKCGLVCETVISQVDNLKRVVAHETLGQLHATLVRDLVAGQVEIGELQAAHV